MGVAQETREDIIQRGERDGWLVPGCLGCKPRYEAENPRDVHAPPHRPSEKCESGKDSHCTCDVCF